MILWCRYPQSVKLVRSYGRFLEDVRGDPWSASRRYAEADLLEEKQESAQQESMLGNLCKAGDGNDANALAAVSCMSDGVVRAAA